MGEGRLLPPGQDERRRCQRERRAGQVVQGWTQESVGRPNEGVGEPNGDGVHNSS